MLSTPQISPSDTDLATNRARLLARIAAAAGAAGRDAGGVTLLAVSKGQEVARLRQAIATGLVHLGENYLSEALPKIRALGRDGLTWHFIGRIQGNKTRPVAEHFDWVHGIDRLRIAERLSAQRPHYAPPLDACIQVNVMGEATKGGVEPARLPGLLRAVATLPRLRLRGLMAMLPYDADAATQHRGFGAMRGLLEEANRQGLALDTLSMGMSDDLEAAIAEGSTLVRVGTALFGARPTDGRDK